MPWNNGRLYLHVIHPCEAKDALLHPHAWKSAMRVLNIGGHYEQGIGYRIKVDVDGIITKHDEIVCRQIVQGEMYYEMTHPAGIHYVRPLLQPVYTIMYAGPVEWPENLFKANKELGMLSHDRKEEIANIFKEYLL